MTKIVPFSQLEITDLVVDAVYEGGNSGTAADDPISKLLPGSGNQGGFRAAGRGADKKVVVLYTSGKDIADILSSNGFNTAQIVETFLKNEFEITRRAI